MFLADVTRTRASMAAYARRRRTSFHATVRAPGTPALSVTLVSILTYVLITAVLKHPTEIPSKT